MNNEAEERAVRVVTTSWDDGHPQDQRVAELLRERGLQGTFYVPIRNGSRARMTAGEVRGLRAEGFEIGAHSLTHQVLPKLGAAELQREVRACKSELEELLGEEVGMFCYPKGRFSGRVVRSVREAGYQAARTTQMLETGLRFRRYEMATTLHAYPHTRGTYVRNVTKAWSARRMVELVRLRSEAGAWVELGKALFDEVLRRGGVWHLFGHAWLIEQLGLWEDLRRMLEYVAGREGVRYASNGELVKYAAGGAAAGGERAQAVAR